ANFYSLGNVSQEQKNGRFVYSIKGLSTLDSADQLKQKAKAKGYPLAHVIAFKNGIQISLKEAAETAMH
ncbi:MAG: N-acetylmuramoyl-L-alanine amidase, partial [Salibacteraceae bacterium]|nr:N-acetylmuramoyl-L-alanine amidase [Salibacteraceae bacterium]MDP4843684.1 N-acetylmuramoyl-L-alanine amidase [Salibacteraceae bacterium]